MTAILIKGRDLGTHAQKKYDARRHREKVVIYKSKREAWNRYFPHCPQTPMTPWFCTYNP
jgi:hypothetical protein